MLLLIYNMSSMLSSDRCNIPMNQRNRAKHHGIIIIIIIITYKASRHLCLNALSHSLKSFTTPSPQRISPVCRN